MTIILHRPWTQQPTGPVQLNSGSSLTSGLQLLLTAAGGRMHDAVNPTRQWDVINNTRISPTVAGQTISFDGVDDALSHTGYPEIIGNVGTFFIWCASVGAGDTNGHAFFGTNTSSTVGFQVLPDTRVHAWSTTSTNSTGSWFGTSNRSLVFTSGGTGASVQSYLDGRQSGHTGFGTPTSFVAGAKAFNAGRWIGGTSWDTRANVLVMGYAARQWTPAEAYSFHTNPHQFFAPRRIIIPVSAAAPTTFIPSWARQNSRVIGGGV